MKFVPINTQFENSQLSQNERRKSRSSGCSTRNIPVARKPRVKFDLSLASLHALVAN